MNGSLGSKCYDEEIKRDLLLEPKTICEVDRRRKCDSLYINLNKRLVKENSILRNKLILINDIILNNTDITYIKSKIMEVIDNDR